MRLLLRSIPLLLLLALLASMFFLPGITPWISITMLATSIGMAIFLSARKHWRAYQQAECTREKTIRNLLLDLLGFLLSMAAAIYAGGMAGKTLGQSFGIWIGLLAGFAGGFVAAWAIRSVWGKLVTARVR